MGRFQPFHRGHRELVRHILQERRPQQLLLAIGSAQASHTLRNPMTAGERMELILRVLPSEDIPRVWPVPVPDVDRHALWVSHVESLLPPFEEVYSNDPLTRLLFQQAGYTLPLLPWFDRDRFEGTRIRQRMAHGEPWEDLVPEGSVPYLKEIKLEERLRILEGSAEARRNPSESSWDLPPVRKDAGKGTTRVGRSTRSSSTGRTSRT